MFLSIEDYAAQVHDLLRAGQESPSAQVEVEGVFTYLENVACIDGVVVRSQNTLPRELELLNVFRAQFVEDAIRDLLREVYRLVRPRSSDGTLSIKSISMESIHDFDMEAEIEFSLRELDGIFGSR